MHSIDYTVIVLYFAAVIGVGFWYKRRAASNLDSYFLGGKRLHWLTLAMSGGVSNFDITGTMLIVALITLFGMNGMWYQWIWGFLMGAFFLSFMGKWIRRSRVMTGAEWMVTRFGDGRDGFTARSAYTLMAVVTVAAFIGYAFQGIGKFAAVYVNLKPAARCLADLFPGYSESIWCIAGHEMETCAVVIFTLTTFYVLLGGLYSVVITDVIQTVMLTAAAILIAVVAYTRITPELLEAKLPPEKNAALEAPADNSSPGEGDAPQTRPDPRPANFTTLLPRWRLPEAQMKWFEAPNNEKYKKYAVYEMFGLFVIVWVLKGLLLNLGGPAQMYDFQRFLAARNPRDAAKVGAAWSGFLIVRWAMVMGLALLFLTGLAEAGDPEEVMPVVLQKFLWIGVRGLVIAGLLAAFMSTFSSTVNSGASYLVRDLWQPLVFPRAGERHLIWASYAATVLLVLTGLVIGFNADSIRAVFDWIMGGLGAAFVIPNVLRWYWWRLNGWGYAIGTLVGLLAALVLPALPMLARCLTGSIEPGQEVPWLLGSALSLQPLYVSFPLICVLSLVATLAATLLTRPTGEPILVEFYQSVRPFGAWGRIRRKSNLSAERPADKSESLPLAALNVALAGTAILGAYLFPMYLVGHWHGRATVCLALAAAAAVGLYFTWYRNLPEPQP